MSYTEAIVLFAHGAFTLCGAAFQLAYTKEMVCNFRTRLQPSQIRSYNPVEATPASLTSLQFRLFPVRSPLLGESQLISVTRGTKMFQFSHFASKELCIHSKDDWALPQTGFPIRKSSDLRMLTPPRRLSQSATSFIASRYQGIHRTPLLA